VGAVSGLFDGSLTPSLSPSQAIVGTGNYAWINFVGMLPVLALFDDAFLARFVFSRKVRQNNLELKE
jgi:hypothetical protein